MENQRSLHHYIPFERSEHDKNYTSCENDSFAEEKRSYRAKLHSEGTVEKQCRNTAETVQEEKGRKMNNFAKEVQSKRKGMQGEAGNLLWEIYKSNAKKRWGWNDRGRKMSRHFIPQTLLLLKERHGKTRSGDLRQSSSSGKDIKGVTRRNHKKTWVKKNEELWENDVHTWCTERVTWFKRRRFWERSCIPGNNCLAENEAFLRKVWQRVMYSLKGSALDVDNKQRTTERNMSASNEKKERTDLQEMTTSSDVHTVVPYRVWSSLTRPDMTPTIFFILSAPFCLATKCSLN